MISIARLLAVLAAAISIFSGGTAYKGSLLHVP